MTYYNQQTYSERMFQIRKDAYSICNNHSKNEIEQEIRLELHPNAKRVPRPGFENDALTSVDKDTLIYSLVNFDKIQRLAPLVYDSFQHYENALAKIEDWCPKGEDE